jgi:hypothetical protein
VAAATPAARKVRRLRVSDMGRLLMDRCVGWVERRRA